MGGRISSVLLFDLAERKSTAHARIILYWTHALHFPNALVKWTESRWLDF